MLKLYENIKKRRLELGYTQTELAKKLGYSDKSMIAKIEKGSIDITQTKIIAFAKALSVTPSHLMGWDDSIPELLPIAKKKFPLISEVACGEPILANQSYDSFILAEEDIDADACVLARGDSMTGARIMDGDIVFLKFCDIVDNGEIAVVIIDDEVTLKRVYYYPEENVLTLQPENPAYRPLIYKGEQLDYIKIIGRAIVFQSAVR